LNPLRTIFRGAKFRNGVIEKIDLDQKEILFSRGLDGKEFRKFTLTIFFLNLGSPRISVFFPVSHSTPCGYKKHIRIFFKHATI